MAKIVQMSPGDLPRMRFGRDIVREVHRSRSARAGADREIWINPKSRDDIPAVLKGIQHIWGDEELRARLLTLLDEPAGGGSYGGTSGNGPVGFWCWGS